MRREERLLFEIHSRSREFARHVAQAERVISEACALGRAYVACSWGKDSVVLLHLVQQHDPAIVAVHLSTPQQELLDNYTEVQRQYCQRWPTQYEPIQIDTEETIPAAVARLQRLQEFAVAFVGLRAEENPRTRGASLATHGLLHQYKYGLRATQWRACPLGYWTWKDIWAYTVRHSLPYLASYDHPRNTDKSRSRTTNVMPFGTSIGTSRRYGRIAQIKHISPKAYAWLQQHAPHIAAFN